MIATHTADEMDESCERERLSLIAREGITVPEIMRQRALIERDFALFNFIRYGRAPDEPLTLKGLDGRANAIAQALHDRDIVNGYVILLFLPGFDFIEAFFGCLYAGLTAIPVHPGRGKLQGRDGLVQMITHTQCCAILASGRQVANAAHVLAENALADNLSLIDIAELPVRAVDTRWVIPQRNAYDQAYLQYTSGSSGKPKGVSVSHANILSNLKAIHQRLQVSRSDVGLSWLPMNHDMGLIGNLLLHVIYGARPMHIMSPTAFMINPLRWLQAITQYGVTITGGPNFAYDLCVQKINDEDKAQLDLSNWSVAFCGAEPIRYRTLQAFALAFKQCGFDARAYCPGYGLAESTLMVTSRPRGVGNRTLSIDALALSEGRISDEVPRNAAVQLVSCGRVIEDHDLMIVSTETGEVLPENTPGEIWIKGPSVTRGYFQSIDDEMKRFGNRHPQTGEGGYLRTGDLGFLSSGELYVTGRLKDLIIIRGRNFMPDFLEKTALASNALLKGCNAVALPLTTDTGECLLLIVEVSQQLALQLDGHAQLADELYQQIRTAMLANHEVDVQEFALVKFAGIPKTTSGKIQRQRCLQDYLQGRLPLRNDEQHKA